MSSMQWARNRSKILAKHPLFAEPRLCSPCAECFGDTAPAKTDDRKTDVPLPSRGSVGPTCLSTLPRSKEGKEAPEASIAELQRMKANRNAPATHDNHYQTFAKSLVATNLQRSATHATHATHQKGKPCAGRSSARCPRRATSGGATAVVASDPCGQQRRPAIHSMVDFAPLQAGEREPAPHPRVRRVSRIAGRRHASSATTIAVLPPLAF